MTDDELRALIEAGATLSIDTNISRSSRFMFELLALVKTIAERSIKVRLVVPAPAFAEILMDLRERYGKRYDPDQIDSLIQDNALLKIEPFTDADAQHMAARLHARYGADAAWQKAKIDAALCELKLGDRIDELRKPTARCSATIDWLIGSQAARAGWVLITEDTGPEFTDLPRVASFNRIHHILTHLSAPPASPA